MSVRIASHTPHKIVRAFSDISRNQKKCQLLRSISSLNHLTLSHEILRAYCSITPLSIIRYKSRSFSSFNSSASDFQNKESFLNEHKFKKSKYFSNFLGLKIWPEGQQKDQSDTQSSKGFNNIHALSMLSAWCFVGYSTYKVISAYSLADILPSVHADNPNRNKNNFIADVVEKAAPAVVFLEILGRHPLSGREVSVSNGSGFIVRENGVILTNAHVVANKSAVSVKLHDGSIHQGQVTAVDPVSDLATVKIPATDLPTIPLGESSKLRPGEWVIALGSPLSLSNTVTCGIVSSVQRGSKELGLRNKDMDYIQTDAVINFGNSGGPLVDLEGRAIGINTMKVTTGISFAIPSDHALKFLKKAEIMMKRGTKDSSYLKRRYMGITMLTLTDSIIRELQKDRLTEFRNVTGGVFVYKVIPGSPAHVAGVVAGDIIVEIDSRPVRSAADVYDAIENAEHLAVTIIRGQIKRVFAVNTKESI